MQVIIFVEGPSDKSGMEKILANIISEALKKGVSITFHPTEGKKELVNKVPVKAVNILRNTPDSIIIALPDLYPQNIGCPHTTFEELKYELKKRFKDIAGEKGLSSDLHERFMVHCFKYDLEVLLLASEDCLCDRLSISKFSKDIKWNSTIEDQNHGNPPKRIIEELFRNEGKKYKDTVDVPWIMERSNINEIIEKCPQHFKPFVDEITAIINNKRQ